jgi:hypothetical protein
MKNKITLITAAILAITSTLFLNSCKKNDTNTVTSESIEDNANAETHFDMIFDQVDDAAVTGGVYSRGKSAVITIDTMSNPRTMTINYGDSNLNCPDGNVRRGKIVVTWTGRYRATGTVITVTPVNFFQNDFKIEGTKTIENKGRNTAGNMQWFITVNNGKVTTPTGETHTWTSDRTRTWVNGESTRFIMIDDKYEITGVNVGTNRKGVKYRAEITSPILVELNCKYHITKGTVSLSNESNPSKTAIVDFGNGTCDNVGTFTFNGVTRTFIKR